MASFQVQIGKETFECRGEDKQWILGKVRVSEGKKTKGEESFEALSFYSDTPGLFKALCEKKLRLSDAETLTDLQIELKKIKDELSGMYDTAMK